MLAIAALAAVAGAALGGGGSPPPKRPLAQALHDALNAPRVAGVSARVKFTSNLFGGATTDTSSALLTGGSGRLWAADNKLRLELQSDNGDAQIVIANGKGFVYDGPSNTAYAFTSGSDSGKPAAGSHGPPALSEIVARLADARRGATISAPAPGVVAGEPAYTVRVTPRDRGGLLGAAAVAWDAARGVPLRIALYPRGSSKPALELKVTDISFSPIGGSVFRLEPPPGARIVDLTGGGATATAGRESHARLSFALNSPRSLAGKARRAVRRGNGGAVVLYGKGLDTIVVAEHAAKRGDSSPAPQQGRDGQPLELPTVSINGAKGTAIGTPLGGVVTFERGGVAYTVAGSQPLAVLETAARGL